MHEHEQDPRPDRYGDHHRDDDPAAAAAPRPARRLQVRVDAAERNGGAGADGQSAGPWRGSLLAGSRAGVAATPRPAAPADRRAEARHDAVECRAWVGWKVWRGFATHDALVVDLSRGGARVFVDAAPPPGQKLWVFLEAPGRQAAVPARAVELRATAAGQCSVRLAFEAPCPYALFEAAVCGLPPADPRARLAPAPRLVMTAPLRQTVGR